MKDFFTRENVSMVAKVAFAVAVGAYAYLYVTPATPAVKGKKDV
jgi:hypothetical protein